MVSNRDHHRKLDRGRSVQRVGIPFSPVGYAIEFLRLRRAVGSTRCYRSNPPDAAPPVFRPPCNHTMTGLGDLGGQSAVLTLRYMQSSWLSCDSWLFHAEICWVQAAPKVPASRAPFHGLTGTGVCHHKARSGGWAYGGCAGLEPRGGSSATGARPFGPST
jgi:hypothetical protein